MFHWIEARAFCHATEEEDRVLAAVRTVMSEVEPRREGLAGHFGNPLLVFTVRETDGPSLRAAWSRIVKALGRDEILRELDERLNEDGIYHLRLDKQRAYLGGIETAAGPDVIAFRAKVAAFPKKRETLVAALRGAVEEA
ncbi:MAG: RNA-binding domain-containing protein [Thermoplasmata archaeon]